MPRPEQNWYPIDAIPTPAQQIELDRLTAQLTRHRSAIASILSLAEVLRKQTIERLMEKSDAEVGLEFLLHGHSHRPRQ